MRPTFITIDLPALAHNIQRVRAFSPTAKVMAMVKADAYGHGAVACLPALSSVDALGVASLGEALPLQQAGWQKKIVCIEGAFSAEEWQTCLERHIDCVIHHRRQLEWALTCLPTYPAATVWLKLNTGMNRLGFAESDIAPIAQQLIAKGYQLVLTSHFANADIKDHPTNQQQIATFERVLSLLQSQVSPSIEGSLCNSAGLVNFTHHQYDWVRPGIILYGATPVTDRTASELDLRPVMHVAAEIIAIHDLQVGDSVGYGSRWQARTPARIGIVSIGYADGYPRVVNDNAYVTVKADGQKLPIIGRVAMDMLMVDITHASAVQLGTAVSVWGDSPSIDEVADWNGTISYERLSLVTPRPHWQYLPVRG